MKRLLSALTIATLAAVGACTRGRDRAADSALNTDLSLAAQQRGASLDTLSAAERQKALNGTAAKPATSGSAAAHTTSATHRRASSSSGSGSTGSSSGAVAQSHEVTVKHTRRDAAIGAGAGAVIGAVTSKNKVKGGVIGAAVGGILGGVIGNNVDKEKKRVP